MSSREIVLRLDERWYQTLIQQLEVEKLEDKLNEYLDNLISILPGTVYDTIIDELREEHSGGGRKWRPIRFIPRSA